MNINRIREELPIWSLAGFDGPEHIMEDDRQLFPLPMSEKARVFWKNHFVLIAAVVGLLVWTVAACWITATIVRNNTTIEVSERVKHEMLGSFQSYTEQMEQQRMAESLLTGDASLQAQIEQDATAAAKLMNKYKTKRMKQTVLLNAWARMKSGLYPNTIEAVVSQANQFQFWSDSNPVKADDYQLAYGMLTDLYDGKYPAGFDDSFIYGEWSEDDYVLRNIWEKNSKTVYYRMPE